jgi:mRNA interferase RelE/StbE
MSRMLKLTLANEAKKALLALQAKQFKQMAVSMLNLLTDPYPHDSESLKGASSGERRVDIGEYRIIYSVTGDAILVLVIGKRNDGEAYKRWERMK